MASISNLFVDQGDFSITVSLTDATDSALSLGSSFLAGKKVSWVEYSKSNI